LGLSNYPGLPNPLDGKLDEIYIANKTLSEEWISVEYINQNDPSGFYSISSEARALTFFHLFLKK